MHFDALQPSIRGRDFFVEESGAMSSTDFTKSPGKGLGVLGCFVPILALVIGVVMGFGSGSTLVGAISVLVFWVGMWAVAYRRVGGIGAKGILLSVLAFAVAVAVGMGEMRLWLGN
jgi:hypothetical protein